MSERDDLLAKRAALMQAKTRLEATATPGAASVELQARYFDLQDEVAMLQERVP